MATRALDDAVRQWVAQGVPDLSIGRVLPGNFGKASPKEPYATVLFIRHEGQGLAIHQQLPDGQTAQLLYRRAVYSVQFHRDGAVGRADALDTWSQTENGLLAAETAFSDGQLAYIHILDGGSGYTSNPDVEVRGGAGQGATAQAYIMPTSGRVALVRLTNRGERYMDSPEIRLTGGGGSGAVATARGFGFRVVLPINIRRLDEVDDDSWEERGPDGPVT